MTKRIKAYLSEDLRITYYKQFIQPHLDYCSVVWGHSNHVIPQSEIREPRILKLQKMAMRIICDKPRLAHSGPLFKHCKILKISDRVRLRSLTTVHKAIHGETTNYISDMFRPLT